MSHSLDQAEAAARAKVQEYVGFFRRAVDEGRTPTQAGLVINKMLEVQNVDAERARALFATAVLELAAPAADLTHLDFDPGF